MAGIPVELLGENIVNTSWIFKCICWLFV